MYTRIGRKTEIFGKKLERMRSMSDLGSRLPNVVVLADETYGF